MRANRLTQSDIALLSRFVRGHRSEHDTVAALQRLELATSALPVKISGQARREYQSQLRIAVQARLDRL